MTSHRFEIIPVPEPTHDNLTPETIPLVNIENEIPPRPPPLPASLISTNETKNKRIPSRLFNTYLRRQSLNPRHQALIAAASKKHSSSLDIIRSDEPRLSLPIVGEVDDSDVYATIQSNIYPTNSTRIPNKFLQELRLKRRELHEKAKNISIDQRIAFNRQRNVRPIIRAQDIFDVHFELNDDDDDVNNNNKELLAEINLFSEESQEKIRNDIYYELNRQRRKQCHKQHRHLLFGRSLLLFMTSLLALMSFTLIYVVSDTYNRASYLDKLPENEFLPMVFDKTSNSY